VADGGVILLDDGGWETTSMLCGEDSMRCSQGATRAQRAAGDEGGGGSRITTGEDSRHGGRSCQAEAELTSNRGLVLRREGQRGWHGRVAGLSKESGGFHKKREQRRRRWKARQQGKMRKKRFEMSYGDKKKTHYDLTTNDIIKKDS
jgi:hypothetical protein